MDSSAYEDGNESSVDEGAFWHTNMDLFYGHFIGEIVEVEHEQNKYWLASIGYCYKHLLLLKWVGNYGEFWIDTSQSNASVSTSSAFKSPKRIFPLGFHQQSQLKSQFQLEKPTDFLVKSTLYDPTKDPYANIQSVEDLLDHKAEQPSDTFDINQSSVASIEPANLALAKCKTKIDYGQEDLDELEAALNNLIDENSETDDTTAEQTSVEIKSTNDGTSSSNLDEISACEDRKAIEEPTPADSSSENCDSDEADQICYELCKRLQELATNEGHYFGVNPDGKSESNQLFYVKPKQVYDTGGANHERVFVPGTLLSIQWTDSCKRNSWTDSDILEDRKLEYRKCRERYWFAYVVKNTGGRLTLRWFLCDEPKFKQGRLELKSCRSKFVIEDDDQTESDKTTKNRQDDNKTTSALQDGKCAIHAKDITFSLHFCDPRIHTIVFPMHLQYYRWSSYLLPEALTACIRGSVDINQLRLTQMEHILDTRRINLDKDRPLIDHILSTIQSRAPKYLDVVIPEHGEEKKQQVLISSSRMTKLIRGEVTRVTRGGVCRVKCLEKVDDEEELQFLHPFDSAYTILPLDWADDNQDCLSIEPSRNPSPTLSAEKSHTPREGSDNHIKCEKDVAMNTAEEAELVDKVDQNSVVEKLKPPKQDIGYTGICLKNLIADMPYAGGPYEHPGKKYRSLDACIANHMDPHGSRCWLHAIEIHCKWAEDSHCCIDTKLKSQVEEQFKVMSLLEVVHPLSDTTICLGRIRKVVFPLLWIQISSDCYTVLPFNSTNIYPLKWCERHGHPLVSLLPPRKRALNLTLTQQTDGNRKRKKTKSANNNSNGTDQKLSGVRFKDQELLYEKEHFNLNAMNSRQADLTYMLNEKSNYIKIYFNHKCFTGPSLSKSKICSLPQYVGPGPLDLVLEEVVTKIISVAYVPPRILNDLSSATFKQLLVERGLANVHDVEFKAKYQKRVHRDGVPVCIGTEDVALYCETLCEHIKCCYNLFGLQLYDGDDCPGHCRALTKSNKFMKRATYYRDKARAGEFINLNNNANSNEPSQNNKKVNSANAADNLLKTSRARYAGRGSSESNSSSVSRSEQVNSRASSAGDDLPSNGLGSVSEANNEEATVDDDIAEQAPLASADQNKINSNLTIECEHEPDMENVISLDGHPDEWSSEEIERNLEICFLSQFKSFIESEGIDGQALFLLDRAAIVEHLEEQFKTDYSPDEVNKFCRFVELVKNNALNSSSR